MLYNKIQPWSFLCSGEEDFKVFLPYTGMAAILFNDAEPLEYIDNTPSTERLIWNLVKIGQAVSEKKMFTDYEILYLYIAKGQVQKTSGDKILNVTERFCYFDHIL